MILFKSLISNGVIRGFSKTTNKTTEEIHKFTSIQFDSKDEKGLLPKVGRAWRASELRLKSTEELHKLWYVLLIERNAVESDYNYMFKVKGEGYPEPRLVKIKESMSRLLTVVNDRKKIQREYRSHLEDTYAKKKYEEYNEELSKQPKEETIKVPKISFNLLRAKYNDLNRGVDNIDYIKEAVKMEEEKSKLLEDLRERYDYKNKKYTFTSFITEQIKSGNKKVSNEEVLRAHVKNWKALNLKQRRQVISMLNARRANEAKNKFLKELNLLAQKIAFEENEKENK